jgi:hypothetical protein
MSGTIAYVENLSDGELYNELRKRGFSAGPVVGKSIYCVLYIEVSIANVMLTTHSQTVALWM